VSTSDPEDEEEAEEEDEAADEDEAASLFMDVPFTVGCVFSSSSLESSLSEDEETEYEACLLRRLRVCLETLCAGSEDILRLTSRD